jgi:hypothetical protein
MSERCVCRRSDGSDGSGGLTTRAWVCWRWWGNRGVGLRATNESRPGGYNTGKVLDPNHTNKLFAFLLQSKTTIVAPRAGWQWIRACNRPGCKDNFVRVYFLSVLPDDEANIAAPPHTKTKKQYSRRIVIPNGACLCHLSNRQPNRASARL